MIRLDPNPNPTVLPTNMRTANPGIAMRPEKLLPSRLMNGRPIPVLIVEDDDGLNHLIMSRLLREDFLVQGVATGQEALSKIRANPDALLLLDYALPDMTGMELLDRLAEHRLECPFIMMSGHGNEQVAVDLMKRGARDYLVKDGNWLELVTPVVNRVLLEIENERRMAAIEADLRQSRAHLRLVLDTVPVILWSIDREERLTLCTGNDLAKLGASPDAVLGRTIAELLPQNPQAGPRAQRALAGDSFHFTFELQNRIWEGSYAPIRDHGQAIIGATGIATDVTARRRADTVRERLIQELRDALGRVKVLRGLIPICASCKKIRDDRGYWNQVESYLQQHSDAQFTHGLCPECSRASFPQLRREEHPPPAAP